MRSEAERGVDKIARLARQPVDVVRLWQECTAVIGDYVPYYQAPCWYTLDPASLLITSHYHDGLPEFPSEWLASEYYEDGANRLADVVRSESGISTLHDVTAGHPSDDPRWHRNMILGGDQEIVVRLRAKSGQVWGALALYREPGRALFDAAEKSFLSAVSPHLAEGARRALLVGEAADPEGVDAPGLLILNDKWEVESATPGVERWISELPDGDWSHQRLPSSVLAVAGRALRSANLPGDAGEVAVARVLTRRGTWVVLHGASLVSGVERRVAIIVEPGHPARIHPLLMSAYGLTEREQEVTRMVLQGDATADIAAELHVSPHTVQQHLKSIFGKTGVRSRRDLVGKVFFAYYEPRLRDNERRTRVDLPMRGGPVDPGSPDYSP
ncbi:DNA-binding CsgD family transcriptional regulator [Hamadaea flava]|uniref:LuxR C-terminal-related transcriptional regulator n=1 Tax=Hamadaea flava TaxID=1742688 RepID=A0ABV8M091_9ACTN|nr:helix-turn-helix transcriptional regulator [Hamadaea flava]MCP2326883.1 DNA-binding CsgD family transcriptional regulator [Hamadaea flava]